MSKKPKKIDKPSLRPVYICGATAEDINKAFETGDIIKICEAIGVATRLANVSAIAKRTGIVRWSRFLRQAVKVDLLTKRMIHHEDTQTVYS
jgi:hypothetical protein